MRPTARPPGADGIETQRSDSDLRGLELAGTGIHGD